MTQTERRRYFRINDTVGLDYQLTANESATQNGDNLAITSTHLLQHINKELNRMTNALWQESPVAAEALGLLNKKLDVIANSIGQGEKNDDFLTDTDVSISACGIAFPTTEPLNPGSNLTVTLGLKPSNVQLAFEGTVIACEALTENSGYLCRVEFLNNDPLIEEQLIQHIVQRQSAQLVKQKTG